MDVESREEVKKEKLHLDRQNAVGSSRALVGEQQAVVLYKTTITSSHSTIS